MLPQPGAVVALLGARVRERAVALEHAVLLDHDPAVVAAQLRAEALEVDVALAERAEQAAAPGADHVGALFADPLEDLHPRVLEVDRADPLPPVAQALDRVAARDREVA